MASLKSACCLLPFAVALLSHDRDDLSLVQFQASGERSLAAANMTEPIFSWHVPPADYVDWKFCDAEYHSNLGGHGPDDGPEELRYKNVVDHAGVALDLVVKTVGSLKYQPKAPKNNGRRECFGVINLKANGAGRFRFTFVHSGTDHPVVVDHSYFTIFDIDSNAGNFPAIEGGVLSTDAKQVYVHPTHELAIGGSLETGITFQSTVPGNGDDNPNTPDTLTEQQKQRAMTVSYYNTSSWEVEFHIAGGREGRNILFAAYSNLVDPAMIIYTPSPTPAPEPSPTSAPTKQCIGNCSVYEDPHITVFDGKQISLMNFGTASRFSTYRLADFAGAGDMWLVKSSPVFIQARYTSSADRAEESLFVRKVAVGGPFLNGSILVLGPLEEKVTWNGTEILESQTSQFSVPGVAWAERHVDSELVEDMSQSNKGIDVYLPMGVKLTVNRQRTYVNVFIQMPRVESGMDGLCGNFNGYADDDLLNVIVEHRNPKVKQGESLFDLDMQRSLLHAL